jgi:hypothetical protein
VLVGLAGRDIDVQLAAVVVVARHTLNKFGNQRASGCRRPGWNHLAGLAQADDADDFFARLHGRVAGQLILAGFDHPACRWSLAVGWLQANRSLVDRLAIDRDDSAHHDFAVAASAK